MSVASKNLFDLLGNDVEDADAAPPAPVKTVEKTSTHTVKRNADGVAPATKAPAQAGNRRGGASGNEAAFRDRNAGSDRNRGKPVDEVAARGARGGSNARARGGRGARFPRAGDDRHTTKTAATGSEKQAAQSWGAAEGEAELKDEQAGEEIAKTEQKEAAAEGDAVPEATAEEEEEEKQVSYEEYLAQQLEKKAALDAEAALNVRQANEGVEDTKWADAKPLVKEEEDAFIVAKAGKAKRERERKTKQVVELENRFIETRSIQQDRPRGGRGDGARGGGRGGEGRGRGGRGRGAPRGGDFRGEFRGARGGRGGPAGAENQRSAALNPSDESAFPSLGGK
ncbi:Stm1-domain-containing protein [Podospora didyma]|uniref:Stm1-domain-containing protein n=1 Tax=Podospora didyma TaxID=330526 RepID=A0AAE0K1C5_9PEZI|nr:Stm1-domain-containing protein [Podospora didyma]